MTAMFEGNIELMQNRVRPHHIEHLVSCVLKRGRQPAYLQFLVAICRSGMEAVPTNQYLVTDIFVKQAGLSVVPRFGGDHSGAGTAAPRQR